jgi:hypothetical protein
VFLRKHQQLQGNAERHGCDDCDQSRMEHTKIAVWVIGRPPIGVNMGGCHCRRGEYAKQDQNTQECVKPSGFECLWLHRAKLSLNSFDVKSELKLSLTSACSCFGDRWRGGYVTFDPTTLLLSVHYH